MRHPAASCLSKTVFPATSDATMDDAPDVDDPLDGGRQYAHGGRRGLAVGTTRKITQHVAYMNQFLALKELDSFGTLLRENDETLCRIRLWQELGTWLHTDARHLSDNTKRLKHAHALGILSALTNETRRHPAFVDHTTWAQEKQTLWLTDLRREVENRLKARERDEGEDGGEEICSVSTEQLARWSKHWNTHAGNRLLADSLEKAAAVVISMMCVGRAGEFVYLSADKFHLHPSTGTFAIRWTDRKNTS
jgi:hypothetical protein